jgi:hypothetical protein
VLGDVVEVMQQATAKQQAEAIKVRDNVPVLAVSAVLKAVRCLYIEDFPKEASHVETVRISFPLMFAC